MLTILQSNHLYQNGGKIDNNSFIPFKHSRQHKFYHLAKSLLIVRKVRIYNYIWQYCSFTFIVDIKFTWRILDDSPAYFLRYKWVLNYGSWIYNVLQAKSNVISSVLLRVDALKYTKNCFSKYQPVVQQNWPLVQPQFPHSWSRSRCPHQSQRVHWPTFCAPSIQNRGQTYGLHSWIAFEDDPRHDPTFEGFVRSVKTSSNLEMRPVHPYMPRRFHQCTQWSLKKKNANKLRMEFMESH